MWIPTYVTWQSVRYKPELVVKTVLIREYSNGEKLYQDLDAKGKKIRIWYSVPAPLAAFPCLPTSWWNIFYLEGKVRICRMHGFDFGCTLHDVDTIGM